MDRTSSAIDLNVEQPNRGISSHRTGSQAGELSRRRFLSVLAGSASATLIPGISAALLSSMTGCASAPGSQLRAAATELDAPPLGREPFDLLEVAAEHVRIAEASRPTGTDSSYLWGRIGGSRAEGASGNLLEEQLRPWVHGVRREGFAYEADRADGWRLAISGGTVLNSAVPAPVSARFPDGVRSAPLHAIREEADWEMVRGRWLYLAPQPGDSLRRNPAREVETYARAVRAGAAGMVFALPTPPGTWRSVIQADPDAPTMEELFSTSFHPIPCFCVDAEDGARLAEAAVGAADLQSRIVYEPLARRNGENVVGLLRGADESGVGGASARLGAAMLGSDAANPGAIAFLAKLDAPFSGATESASGLATLVGLAQQLALGPRLIRRSDIYFVGLSSQQDGAAGWRAFAEADPARFASIGQFYFLHRTDAAVGQGPGIAGDEAGAPVAYVGEAAWNGLPEALPQIFMEAGMHGAAPQIARKNAVVDAAIGGQRRGAKTFALDCNPPYALTDHDTIDKLSAEGLARSVDFHLRVIETAGALVAGTYRKPTGPAHDSNRA